MSASRPSSSLSKRLLGYLTYVELPLLGVVGGLLTVDLRARPVEFLCSAPVLASRTQEILYGSSLRETIVCDNIGSSLLAQQKQCLEMLITDEPLAMTLQETCETPIALLPPTEDRVAELCSDLSPVSLGATQLYFTVLDDQQSEQLSQLHQQYCGQWDLREPLERIREAVMEAHRAAA